MECGRPRVTLSGTWSCVILARHGGGACGAGGVKGPWCVQTVSTHSRAPLGCWAEGRSQLLKLQGCRRVILHLECYKSAYTTSIHLSFSWWLVQQEANRLPLLLY